MTRRKGKSKTDAQAPASGAAEASQVERELPASDAQTDGDHGSAAPVQADIDERLRAMQDEVATLQTQLTEAEARANTYLDGLQRERAEFQNYKKRVERERSEQQQAIVGNVLLKLLPTLDDFHRAMDAVPADQRDEWFNGVALIQRKLESFLKDYGVTEVEALGQPFDPNLHEAIGTDDSTDAAPETVTQVLQRGYKINDRLLRAALVRVAP